MPQVELIRHVGYERNRKTGALVEVDLQQYRVFVDRQSVAYVADAPDAPIVYHKTVTCKKTRAAIMRAVDEKLGRLADRPRRVANPPTLVAPSGGETAGDGETGETAS